ncbi:SCO4848 family membrane protein [Frankia sp. CiP3]|uniref:SCO4848 family membrane protein n=1 Tax=Frankia sp. CiP3 TaxID=2880971 RepID=UPI001EF6E262|nr:hypothetical protein [Frankia sp. CiP3]
MTLSKKAAWFLVAVGVWTWTIWPTFLKNIWADDRSWSDGPTGFFLVHLVLTAVSLAIGSVVGWLGIRGVRAARQRGNGDASPSKRLINSGR